MINRRVIIAVSTIPSLEAALWSEVAKELLAVVIGSAIGSHRTLTANHSRCQEVVRNNRVGGTTHACRAACQRTGRVVTCFLPELFLLAPSAVNRCITPTVSKVATHNEIDLVILAIGTFSASGIIKAACI